MKGASMTLSEVLFGILFVFIAIAGISTFTDNVFVNYGITNVTSYSAIGNVSGLSSQMNTVQSDLQNAQESASAGSILGAGYYGVKGGWDSLLTITGMTNMFATTVTTTMKDAPSIVAMPSWLYIGIMTAFTLIIIFALLAFIGKVNL